MKSKYDAIIIGGGLAGLTAAYTCQQFGFTPLILEKGNELGGSHQSMTTKNGATFDAGYHTLDYGRSPIATRFFQKMLNQKFRLINLKRGLIIQDHLFPWNAPLQDWPASLRELFSKADFSDDIQSPVKKKDLERVYGADFVRLVEQDILPSYPSKKWSLENGANFEEHVELVYPWFFPQASKTVHRNLEWESFHDKMRAETPQVLYPESGGFQSFIQGIESKVRTQPHRIETNCDSIEFLYENSPHQVSAIKTKNERFEAPLVFWCAPIAQFFHSHRIPFHIEGKPQKIALGNFEFRNELPDRYHEILVGSSSHLINRISFPGKIAGKKNTLLQVEYYYPADTFSHTTEDWKQLWLKSLQETGVIHSHECSEFHFHESYRGFATQKNFDTVSDEIKSQLSSIQTDVVFPFPMIGPENINRLVPETIFGVLQSLNRKEIHS